MLALFKAIDAERRERSLSDAEKAGLVKFFDLTVELGWKTMGTYLQSQLANLAMVPMPVIRAAFEVSLISDGDAWAEAVEQRNIMTHVYDASTFDALVARAGDDFMPVFDALVVQFQGIEAE